jgi:hypothetical protein
VGRNELGYTAQLEITTPTKKSQALRMQGNIKFAASLTGFTDERSVTNL